MARGPLRLVLSAHLKRGRGAWRAVAHERAPGSRGALVCAALFVLPAVRAPAVTAVAHASARSHLAAMHAALRLCLGAREHARATTRERGAFGVWRRPAQLFGGIRPAPVV